VTREGATQRISFSVFFWTVWIEQGYDMPSDISLSYTFILFGSDVKHHTIALHAAHNAHTHQFEDAGQLALKNKWVCWVFCLWTLILTIWSRCTIKM